MDTIVTIQETFEGEFFPDNIYGTIIIEGFEMEIKFNRFRDNFQVIDFSKTVESAKGDNRTYYIVNFKTNKKETEKISSFAKNNSLKYKFRFGDKKEIYEEVIKDISEKKHEENFPDISSYNCSNMNYNLGSIKYETTFVEVKPVEYKGNVVVEYKKCD